MLRIGVKLTFLRTLGVDIFKHKLCDAISVSEMCPNLGILQRIRF